jgi:UPF0755 protein
MKAFFRFLAWCFVTAGLIVAVIGGAGYWLYREAESPGPLAAAKTVVVPAHTGTAAIGKLLADNGVIRYPLLFEAVAKVSGRGAQLHSGEFEFPAGASLVGALDMIASGRTVHHRLTVPEGLTSAEVVALVAAAPALTGDSGPAPAEGDLYPDTYVYSYGEPRQELIERMRQAMAHALADAWAKRRADLPLASPRDVLVLASLIEKETPREEERPHIAGVFVNRLRLGMPLQSDPTVMFAIASGGSKLDRPLVHADLAFSSPYNTYLNKGLPPGAIANPGKSSLRAAVRPERTEDLYFVADGSGGHAFGKTLAAQSRNITAYRRATTIVSEPEVAVPTPAIPAPVIATPAVTTPVISTPAVSTPAVGLPATTADSPGPPIPAQKPAPPAVTAKASVPAAHKSAARPAHTRAEAASSKH